MKKLIPVILTLLLFVLEVFYDAVTKAPLYKCDFRSADPDD